MQDSKNGLTRKKIRTVAVERRAEYRASFMARALSFEREMLMCVLDETGSDATTQGNLDILYVAYVQKVIRL